MIVDWATKFGDRTLLEHAERSPSFAGDLTLPKPGLSVDITAVAEINGSRWIARCPCEGCNGAEYVNLDAPYFFCCECRNAAWDHHLLKVTVPPPGRRAQIAAYLLARPAPATRNWEPGDSIAKLRDENKANGIRAVV